MEQRPLTAAARAETVARASYGRLLAILAAETGDIARAEDALADAFERALVSWPAAGVPANPEAWIVTVARNRGRDIRGSAASRLGEPLADGPALFDSIDLEAIPDKRLELMFVCAHPAIEPAIRAPLMLQTVLGFESKQIATAYAVPTAAMAQRLVRAKRRIRDARIPFTVPDLHDVPQRLEPVLEAIYATYSIDWQLVSGATVRESLAAEALYLAETLAVLLRDEPEAWGLAALIALSLARAGARRDANGAPVALADQDRTLWDAGLILRGERMLRTAHVRGAIGRFQLEAAIQSVHASGQNKLATLRRLHEGLLIVAPTLGALVSHAAIVGELDGPLVGLALLDTMDGLDRFQPAWATRAHLLARAGLPSRAAYDRAISLTTDPAVRDQLALARDSATP